MQLVIVESPAKAKTIEKYLGRDYRVLASYGHVRDLPPKDGSVRPDEGFAMDWEVYADKAKRLKEIADAAKTADRLILATDPDREGEAISWHVLELLKARKALPAEVERVTFNAITKQAVTEAMKAPRQLDTDLIDAYLARRALDYLFGFTLSPVLWRKLPGAKSAGRVQSVALRLIVSREREIEAFVAQEYWSVIARMEQDGTGFDARLVTFDGQKLERLSIGDGATAARAKAAVEAARFTVEEVETRPLKRHPAPPFTTSTLQQESSRKLRMNSQTTMRTAQRLYENGYITYMRTDSTTLSGSAINAARSQARDMYGADYVPEAPRVYGKKAKNAQEAHEAIRPAGDRFRTPAQVAGELRGQEYALYELIWKRTVASQMADAKGSTGTVRLEAGLPEGTRDGGGTAYRVAEFSASGTVITFRGFLAAYEEGRDESRYTGAEADEEGVGRRLPKLSEGVALETLRAEAQGHQTSPPARYTEATLVKALEEKGIGRPSTYAATVGTIQDRGYVRTRGSALIPTWLAFAVTQLLERHFPTLVDYDFTASMEEDLDRIARGDEQRVAWLKRFYFGPDGTEGAGLRDLVQDLDEIDARGVSTVEIGEGVVVRVGRYGPYVEVEGAEGEPRRATVPEDIAPDEMTPEKGRELLEVAADDGRVLGQDPATGHDVVARAGRYGPYVTEVLPESEEPPKRGAKKPKPRTGSLFQGMDLATIDLETALRLMSLPRVVGADPESGEEITAQNGRYGPYLKKGTDSRSLTSEEQIFGISLEEALAIYAQPKQRGRAAAKPPLAELGADPVSGKPVVVKEGRFGPYVTDGETNATLRKDDDPESITPERGFELLEEKRAKGPTTRKRAAKKTTAKKATAKKTTARKTAAKKA